jgi:hypothetical protein
MAFISRALASARFWQVARSDSRHGSFQRQPRAKRFFRFHFLHNYI